MAKRALIFLVHLQKKSCLYLLIILLRSADCSPTYTPNRFRPRNDARPTTFSGSPTPPVRLSAYLICDDAGHYAGFISYWQFDTFAYIEHFAVNPAARGGGIGACALREFKAMSGLPVVLEVERPGSNDMADRRIAFYRRNGFHTIDSYDYIQPPYAPGLPEVPLLLMCDRPDRIDPAHVDATLRGEVYAYMKFFC